MAHQCVCVSHEFMNIGKTCQNCALPPHHRPSTHPPTHPPTHPSYSTDVGMTAIALACTDLITVEIQGSLITDLGVGTLVASNHKITTIVIGGKTQSRGGGSDLLIAIAANCPDLATINFANLQLMTTEGMIALANGCPLISINLTNSRTLTDPAFIALAHGCLLTTIEMSGCPLVTDAGVIALANGCPLTSVNLSGCSITDTGVIALANGCPDTLSVLNITQTFTVPRPSVVTVTGPDLTDAAFVAIGNVCVVLADLQFGILGGPADLYNDILSDGAVNAVSNCPLAKITISQCSGITDAACISLRVTGTSSLHLTQVSIIYCRGLSTGPDSQLRLLCLHGQANLSANS